MGHSFEKAALVCAALLTASHAVAQDLSLKSVVELALTRNERAEIAEQSVASADAAVSKARAAFLPSISLSANETLRPQEVENNGRVALRSNATGAALTVSQPLLNASAFPLYSAAKHSYESARLSHDDQRRLLAFDTARSFFSVVAQQRVLNAANSRRDLASATLNDTRVRASSGLVSSNDVTRSEIERASAEQSLINAGSAREAARLNLEYLIAAPIEIDKDLAAPTQALVPANQNLAGLVNLAIATRPDLAALRANAASASALADEPRLRFVPTLNAALQARAQDQAIVADRYVDTTLTLNFNWQIWDGGSRSADSSSRDAAHRTAELQLRALARRVETDVRVAVAELNAARAGLVAAQQGQDAARRSAEETSVLYKQGLAKAIELVNGNSSKFDAEVAVAAAELNVHQAELDLRAALGLFPLDGLK